jgi:hypothetical protein
VHCQSDTLPNLLRFLNSIQADSGTSYLCGTSDCNPSAFTGSQKYGNVTMGIRIVSPSVESFRALYHAEKRDLHCVLLTSQFI